LEEIKIQCPSCKGTGIYSGMAEVDSCAVVCYNCKGLGWTTYSYEKFTNRKIKEGIKHIFARTCGYGHSHKDITTEKGKLIEFSKGGCTYEEWLNGEHPKPVKGLYCPYLWTGQELQTKDVNDLYKNYCENALGWGGTISACKHFCDKERCWEIFDKKG